MIENSLLLNSPSQNCLHNSAAFCLQQKLCRDYKKQKYVHKQSKTESQRNAAYIKNIKKKKRNRHQHNTDDGGQAMGLRDEACTDEQVRQAHR